MKKFWMGFIGGCACILILWLGPKMAELGADHPPESFVTPPQWSSIPDSCKMDDFMGRIYSLAFFIDYGNGCVIADTIEYVLEFKFQLGGDLLRRTPWTIDGRAAYSPPRLLVNPVELTISPGQIVGSSAYPASWMKK